MHTCCHYRCRCHCHRSKTSYFLISLNKALIGKEGTLQDRDRDGDHNMCVKCIKTMTGLMVPASIYATTITTTMQKKMAGKSGLSYKHAN